jgi:hypothetical protein
MGQPSISQMAYMRQVCLANAARFRAAARIPLTPYLDQQMYNQYAVMWDSQAYQLMIAINLASAQMTPYQGLNTQNLVAYDTQQDRLASARQTVPREQKKDEQAAAIKANSEIGEIKLAGERREAELKIKAAEREAELKVKAAEREAELKVKAAEREAELKVKAAEREAELKVKAAKREAELNVKAAEREAELKERYGIEMANEQQKRLDTPTVEPSGVPLWDNLPHWLKFVAFIVLFILVLPIIWGLWLAAVAAYAHMVLPSTIILLRKAVR